MTTNTDNQKHYICKLLRRPPRHLASTESDPGFKAGFPDNSNPDICQIAPKMIRCHYLVSVVISQSIVKIGW